MKPKDKGEDAAWEFLKHDTIYYLVMDVKTPNASPFVVPLEIDGRYVPIMYFWSTPERAMEAAEHMDEHYSPFPVNVSQTMKMLLRVQPPWIALLDVPHLTDTTEEMLDHGFGPRELVTVIEEVKRQQGREPGEDV